MTSGYTGKEQVTVGRAACIGFLVAWMVFVPWSGAQTQDKTQTVSPQDLLENPQNYWAQPVVFKDTLVSPAGREVVQIDGQRYRRFQTSQLGNVYAAESILPRLEILETGRDYLFSGTVLQAQGFFRTTYYVIARDLRPAVVASSEEEVKVPDLIRAFAVATNVTAKGQLIELLEDSEEAIFAYMKQENLESPPLLDYGSKPYDGALQVIRGVVAKTERAKETTSRELLTQILAAMIAGSLSPPEPAAAEPPVVTLPAEEAVEPPAPPAVEESPDAPPDAAGEADTTPAPETTPPAVSLKITPYLTPSASRSHRTAPVSDASVSPPLEVPLPDVEVEAIPPPAEPEVIEPEPESDAAPSDAQAAPESSPSAPVQPEPAVVEPPTSAEPSLPDSTPEQPDTGDSEENNLDQPIGW